MIQLELDLGLPPVPMVLRPICELHIALADRRGGTLYGWKTALLAAIPEIKEEHVTQWLKTGRCPEWVILAVPVLKFKTPRRGHTQQDWNKGEYEFLTAICKGEIVPKNKIIAMQCSGTFGRTITESAIKGAIDRLRKRGIINHSRHAG